MQSTACEWPVRSTHNDAPIVRLIEGGGDERMIMATNSKCPYSDVLDPSFVADPYPALAQARQEDPAHYLPDYNMWLVSRYADVRAIFKDPDTFSNANAQQPLFAFAPEMAALLQERGFAPGPAISGSNGPLHKRIRMKIAKGLSFTPRNLAVIKAWVDEEAAELVAAFPRTASFDIRAAFTAQFPAKVIYRLIGFPPEMNGQLLEWSTDRMKLYWAQSTVEDQLAMAEGLAAYWRFCETFVEGRLNDPGDDITGNLIRLHLEEPETLSLKEVATIVFGLVFAGQETTSNALAQMIYLLLEDRNRWEAVKADPKLIDAAFNETLRLAPPVAAWRRLTERDVEIGGKAVPAKSHLLLHLGSTGHDADKWPDADSFRLDRERGDEHLAFGQSGHFCLGAPLARLEARSVIEVLTRLEPDLALVEGQKIECYPNISFRGPKALFVQRGVA